MSDFFDIITDKESAAKWVDQNTEEWYRTRLGRFTSSEIWKLIVEPKNKGNKLSETAMTYIMDKVAEVLTGQSKQQGYAFPLVWGTEQEAPAREALAERLGVEIEQCGFFTYTDHAGGSPDGLINGNGIIEIKCPYDSKNQVDYLMLTDHFDLKRNYREHYWQIQANLLFSNRGTCVFATFDPRMISDSHKLFTLEVKANKDDQDILIEKIGYAVEEKLKLIKLLQ